MATILSQEERERYQKHILLPEIGFTGQEKLKKASILVVGAGGLGCPVLLYLTGAGVGTIGIIDHDLVSLSNLQRQILYPLGAVGKPKVLVAKEQLQAINPHITIQTYEEKFSPENAPALVKAYDLVIDCTDNLAARYLINDVCVQADKPFIYGSVHRFEGQVAVFNFTDANGNKGPSYRCLFPEPSGEAPNCSEIGVIGVLPGLIGMYQAMEAVKIITGIGQNLSGKLLLIDTLTCLQSIINIFRNEEVISEVMKSKVSEKSEVSSCVPQPIYKKITSSELRELLAKQTALQLLDVREGIHREGIAYHNTMSIPFSHLPGYVDEIGGEPMVVVYCQSGRTSAMAAQMLTEDYGLTNVYNLEGGLNDWQKDMKIKLPD